MKTIYYLFYALVIALAIGVTSCKDDDDTEFDYFSRLSWKSYDLSGNVKSVTSIQYKSHWDELKQAVINNGIIESKTILQFDRKGLQTLYEYSEPTSSTGIFKVLNREKVEYDSKNRTTLLISLNSYSVWNEYPGIKQEIVYDDVAKTAIVTQYAYWSYIDGREDEIESKKVYKLTRYGQIDYENYEVIFLDSNIVFNPYETLKNYIEESKITDKSTEYIIKNDSKDNWIEAAWHIEPSNDIYYTPYTLYRTRTIEYY